MEYSLKLDKFSGPLDLLYELVKRRKIEISEISLASVTEQYLAYLERMEEYDLDLVSEFLVIAAELIEIKTRRLLPKDREQESPEGEDVSSLISRLKQYHLFKQISGLLAEYQLEASQLYSRPGGCREISADGEMVLETDLQQLAAAFKTALAGAGEGLKEPPEDEEPRGNEIKYPEIKVEDKSRYILNKLEERPEGFSFPDLIEDRQNRLEIVVTFLAVLELARLCRVRVSQDRLFARIRLSGDGGK